ncbi:flagellar basal body-associated FliL family protein [Xylophilus sp. GW821-FHT01B05]
MIKRKILPLLAALLAGLLMVAAGAAGAWWLLRPNVATTQMQLEKKPEKAVIRDAKYVSLDKVIVMLRSREGEPVSRYMSIDLVFKTEAKTEKLVREQLPLLRSIAVRFLSSYTMDKASLATVEELTTDISRAYAESYAHDDSPQPFIDVMIGKLIIE